MKKLRIIGVILLLIIAIIIVGFLTGILTIPSIKSISYRWGDVSNNTTEIISSITIENNNTFRIIIPRVEVDYTVKMNNIEMAYGTIEKINLKKGDTTIEVSSYISNTKIPMWWVSHIENNETTIVNIEPVVVINAEFIQPHIERPSKTIPIITNLLADINTDKERNIDVGPINLTLNSVSANWGNVSNETTEIRIDVEVHNPLPITVPMPQINYNIEINNISIGNGSIEDSIILKANNDSNVNLVTKVNNKGIDDWFVSHLQNDEHSVLEITISSEIEYEEISYIIDDFLFYTHEFDTDILGTNL